MEHFKIIATLGRIVSEKDVAGCRVYLLTLVQYVPLLPEHVQAYTPLRRLKYNSWNLSASDHKLREKFKLYPSYGRGNGGIF